MVVSIARALKGSDGSAAFPPTPLRLKSGICNVATPGDKLLEKRFVRSECPELLLPYQGLIAKKQLLTPSVTAASFECGDVSHAAV